MGKHQQQKFVDELSREDIEKSIDQYIFDEVDRKLLKRRLLDGLMYKQLAEEFHLCERQIKNRVYKAQEKLFRHYS